MNDKENVKAITRYIIPRLEIIPKRNEKPAHTKVVDTNIIGLTIEKMIMEAVENDFVSENFNAKIIIEPDVINGVLRVDLRFKE